jgi:MFS family permease
VVKVHEVSASERWFAPLRERRFRLFFVGQLSSLAGTAMVGVALAFAVIYSGGKASQVGFVLAAQSVPMVLIAVVGGAVADRFSRRTVMLSADMLRVLSQGTLAAMILSGRAELWHLAFLAVITGVGDALFIPATSGLIVESVSNENRPAANALSELATSIAFTLGPAASGALVALSSPGIAIAIDAVTYAVSAICLILLGSRPHAVENTPTVLQQLREGWRQFVSRPWIWAVLLQFTVFHALVYGPYLVLGPVLTNLHFHGSTGWGLIQGGLGAGAVLGGVVMLCLRFTWPMRAAVVGQLAWAPVVAALGFPSLPLAALMFLSFLAGLGSSVFNISWETSIQDHVPEANLSSVNAYDWMLSTVSISAGLAIAGPLADCFGAPTLLAVGSAIQIATCLALLASRNIRDLPRIAAIADK